MHIKIRNCNSIDFAQGGSSNTIHAFLLRLQRYKLSNCILFVDKFLSSMKDEFWAHEDELRSLFNYRNAMEMKGRSTSQFEQTEGERVSLGWDWKSTADEEISKPAEILPMLRRRRIFEEILFTLTKRKLYKHIWDAHSYSLSRCVFSASLNLKMNDHIIEKACKYRVAFFLFSIFPQNRNIFVLPVLASFSSIKIMDPQLIKPY